MKKVSFAVAKAIKEAGYPQDLYDGIYYYTEQNRIFQYERSFAYYPKIFCVAPTYFEVWLWLWRKKKSCIGILFDDGNCAVEIWQNKSFMRDFESKFDPEESIIAAIEYLCENDLIK